MPPSAIGRRIVPLTLGKHNEKHHKAAVNGGLAGLNDVPMA